MELSNRILGMQASPIRKLVPYANEAVKNGKKVYHLNIGQPDIKTPAGFFTAVKDFNQEVLAYVTATEKEHGKKRLFSVRFFQKNCRFSVRGRKKHH